MSPRAFLTNITAIVVLMALLAVVELALPLFSRPPARRQQSAVNLRLMLVNFVVNWAMMTGAAALAVAFAIESSGLMTRLGLPFAGQLVLGMIVLDFGYGYVAHRAMHWSPLLWRVHRVHHSDPFVDVTTTFRNHPLESLWRSLFVLVPVGVLGIPPEVVVLHRLLSTVNAVFEHANIRVWAPLDRVVSWIWVTPDMHKLHHSREQRETDSNYGNLFPMFDRLLATFTPSERAPSIVYGLDAADEAAITRLAGLLQAPFVARRGERTPAAQPIVVANT
jgi:sterol desaturase/sphingolipid hydroxylase (fatty acid hydroxylase superfamily)